MLKTLLIAGARPNFMKIAPIIKVMRSRPCPLDWRLVHTGQHYDFGMSDVFFEELGIPKPDHFLNAGSGSHAVQTAKIMVEFERVCAQERPALVVVVGDVNSTLACSIVARKMNVEVAHVEAGLRSGDMTMPEEINRIVTDSISNYLFVSERSGIENLRREGRCEEDIHFVGNVMIDSLFMQLERATGVPETVPPDVYEARRFAVVTLHRPSNVDDREALGGILRALAVISRDMLVVFPAHPRTRKNMEAFGLLAEAEAAGIVLTAPLPYLGFLNLWRRAGLVLTDSGGLQEETTALGVPCFTLRENTERPVTIEEGSNTLVGCSEGQVLAEYARFKAGHSRKGRVPQLWDGRAAERIVDVLSAVATRKDRERPA